MGDGAGSSVSSSPARRRHLSRLTLRRFRSHSALDLDLTARPIALYGPNGAGKTNILEAVSLLAPGRGLRGAKAEELAQRPDPIGWSVKGRLEEGAGAAAEIAVQMDLRPGAPDHGKRRVTLDGAPVSQTALAARLKTLWLTPAMDRLWIEGPSERRKFLDRLTLAFDPEHGARAARYERAMRERNRLLKEGGAAPAWLSALEARMAEEGAALSQARLAAVAELAAAQEAGESAFPKAELSLAPAEGPLFQEVEALAAALAGARGRDAAAGRALLGPHRDDLEAIYAAKDMPARSASTGEQKALLISLVLAAARALTLRGAAAPILLLDEVAAHLDEGRRAALYDELTALGAQAWLTGTGPELFEALGPRADRLALSGG
ncbi:MAG: DNA replication/repair protein RecF [Pseudomonadota bacterium]